MQNQSLPRMIIKITNVMLQFIIFINTGIDSDISIYMRTCHGEVSTDQLRNSGKD